MKINSIVREIYVDDNELVNIDWVSDVLGLEILSASNFLYILKDITK